MKTRIILIILTIASTGLSAGGIALARNAALRRISICKRMGVFGWKMGKNGVEKGEK